MSSRAIDREALVRENLAGYQPKKIPNERWQQISDDVERIVTDVVIHRLAGFSADSTNRELRDLALRIGYFLDFSLDTFGDQYADRYTYFDNDTIALFSHFMLTKFSKSYTRRTVDCLRALSKWRLKIATEPHEERRAMQPYTDLELRQLRHHVSGLPTQHRKVNTSRVVSLALGAGFLNREIFQMKGSHLRFESDTVIATSPEDGRTIPVQRDWDEPLRDFIEGKSGSGRYVVLPKAKRHGKDSRPLTAFLSINGHPEHTIRRMRLTWQMKAIQRGATREELKSLSGVGEHRSWALMAKAREAGFAPPSQSIGSEASDSIADELHRGESDSAPGGGLRVVEERTA